MRDKNDKKTTDFEPNITFSGAGVLHVKSSDIIKTENAKKQIEALGKLKEKGFLASV
jgi:hypothetical protein